MLPNRKINIAIFASGNGSNAEAIANHFANSKLAQVRLILTNNYKAGVLQRAARLHIPVVIFDRTEFYQSEAILKYLQAAQVDVVVLAGFLWLVPPYLVQAYGGRMINIHPALLPKYGGKGMYGMKVHQAVADNREAETGITIHLVNEQYDEGDVLRQEKVLLKNDETPESIAEKVHKLEYEFFPKTIEDFIVSAFKAKQ